MDILASMLAYLGCVTGIVAALAVSFVVYFSPVHHAAMKHTAATAAHSSALRVTTIAQAKLVSTADQHDTSVTPANTDKVETAVQPASVPAPVAVRRKIQLSRTQYYRRLVQEERARRWAYQQDPDFEARFLGYAD